MTDKMKSDTNKKSNDNTPLYRYIHICIIFLFVIMCIRTQKQQCDTDLIQ